MKPHFPIALKPLIFPIRLDALGFFFVSFAIPVVAHQQFSANGWQMGLLFSLQAVGTGCSALLFAARVNKWSNRAALACTGAIVKMIAYLCLYAAIITSDYLMMVFATFCLGLASGLFWLVWQTCVAQVSEFDSRAEALGVASKQVGIGIMWGSCFAFSMVSVAEQLSLSVAVSYISLIVFSVASGLAGINSYKVISVIAVQQDQQRVERETKISFTTITIFLFILIFVGELSGSLVAPFLEVYLLEYLKITSIVELSIAYIPGGIISMLLAPRLGRYADKINAAVYLAVAGMTGAFTTWLMLQSSSLWHISLLFIIDASIITSSGLVLAKLISEVAGERKGSAFGLQGFVSNSGRIAGPLVGGAFWQVQGSQGPFMFSISTELILALCCFAILYPLLRNSSHFLKLSKPNI